MIVYVVLEVIPRQGSHPVAVFANKSDADSYREKYKPLHGSNIVYEMELR